MSALPLPRLDDRSYEELVAEARGLVATLPGGWTDHNASDPGITLIELFAWLAEMLMYRADQIPDRHRIAFLRLLNGPRWEPEGRAIDDQVAETLRTLRTRYRAVTCSDWEALTVEASPEVARALCVPRRHLEADPEAERPGELSVVVVPVPPAVAALVTRGRHFVDVAAGGALNTTTAQHLYVGAAAPFRRVELAFASGGANYTLTAEYSAGSDWKPLGLAADPTRAWTVDGTIEFEPPVDWSVMDVARRSLLWVRFATTTTPPTKDGAAIASRVAARPLARPRAGLLDDVAAFLDPRRLLTTHYHVVAPMYAPVRAEMVLCRREDAPDDALRRDVADALRAMLDTYSGGNDGDGWPIGRSVFLSEVYDRLERVRGVDFVADVVLESRCAPTERGCAPATEIRHENGDQVGLRLAAHQLPDMRVEPDRIFIGDAFVDLSLDVDLELRSDVDPATAMRAAKDALRKTFHPGHQPDTESLWKPKKLAELRSLVKGVDGVVDAEVRASALPAARISTDAAGFLQIALRPGELVNLDTRVRVVT